MGPITPVRYLTMHPDDRTLLDILAKRSDLSRPRQQEHFFFLPTRTKADTLADQAATHGWLPAEPPRPHDGQLPWALTLRRSDQPTNHTTIAAARELFTTLAANAGGLYDGWQALTDVGLDQPTDGAAILLEELDDEDRAAIDRLTPLLEKLGALRSADALADFIAAGRPAWKQHAAADPASADDVVHLVGTAAGELISRATGLVWVLLVEGDHEEIVLADAERGIVRPYSSALEWWEDADSTDIADFVRAGILLVQ